MKRIAVARAAPIVLLVPAGCAGMDAKYPQTPDEFLATYNWGGIFQNREKVQEKLDKPPAGTPAQGMITVVAEVKSVGKTNTEVGTHHLAKPFIADPLKKRIAGDKRECPAL